MGYFPFFMELEGREGLVVGGGAVALRKLQKLLPYGPRLTVAAPEIRPEIEAGAVGGDRGFAGADAAPPDLCARYAGGETLCDCCHG